MSRKRAADVAPLSGDSDHVHLGVSPPISVAGPKEGDLQASAALAEALGLGSRNEEELREQVSERVLSELEALVVRWVRGVGLDHGLSDEQASEAGAKLLLLGSYALLEVRLPAADVDVVAVVPYFVERAQFFGMAGLAGQLRSQDGVHSLLSVPDAFVPIIKFTMHGVPVDLLLARLRMPQIPPSLSADDDRLMHRCMEETDAHSLNGARVAAAILRLVPRLEPFRCTLRAVKLWVTRRRLACHPLGLPGGVAWALLTARVCQLYPNAAPSTLFSRFFTTWGMWKFGASALPVLLAKEEERIAEPLPPHLAALDWNPTSKRDRAYLMPVITPCRPRLCATHTVCRSTLAVLKAEFQRAAQSLPSTSQPATAKQWGPIFAEADFFGAYRGFVAVQVSAADAAQLLHWHGWVKSRLRRLVLSLEKLPAFESLQPLPHALSACPARASAPGPHVRCCFFIGVHLGHAGSLGADGDRAVDVRPAAAEFVEALCAWEHYRRLCPTGQVHISFARQAELPLELRAGALPFVDEQEHAAPTFYRPEPGTET
jgi:poly(A) polymerase